MAKKSIGYELSKSTLMRSVQCQKSLYLYKYQSQLREKHDFVQQAIFNRGHSVGSLAQQLFPNGKDLTPSSPSKWLQSALATKYYIDSKLPVMYEAAFIHQQVVVAVDILVFNGSKWDVYEVKSSIRTSDTYVQDAAIQHHIIKSTGLDIENFYLVTLNGNYVRKGALDIKQLFSIKNVTKELISKEEKVKKIIENALETLLAGNVPDVTIGGHCAKPYSCDFMQHCWGNKLETEVYKFGSINLEEKAILLNKGITQISNDILQEVPHLDKEVLKAHYTNEAFFDLEKIKTFLSTFEDELYFIDMEAFQPAVPVFDNCSPFETIPFLASIIHYKKEETHSEEIIFLDYEPQKDLRKSFLEQFLLHTRIPIPIVVYGNTFEKSILNRLANLFPEYKEDIQERVNKIIDLSIIFQKKYFYHPKMNGSSTLKKVAETLFPSVYQYITVKDGREAATSYEAYYQAEIKNRNIVDMLKNYCSADTLALLEAYKYLKDKVE